MNTMSSFSNIEPRWRTYLKAMVFLLPAIVCWQFACVFLVPRLGEYWQKAGSKVFKIQWIMDIINFLVGNGLAILIVLLLILVLSEFYFKAWGCYRKIAVSILVWLLNAIVLVELTAMVIVALLVSPYLHTK